MELEDRILIITDSISVNAALVFWVFQHFPVQLHGLSIITQASLLDDSLCFEPDSVSSVISISTKAGFHTQLWLKELAKILRPNGFLLVQEPSYLNHNNQQMLGDSRASLERNLLFAGFYSIEGFQSLNYYDEISFQSQHLELIAMKAKKACVSQANLNFSKPTSLATTETDAIECFGVQQKEIQQTENLPQEEEEKGSLNAPKKGRKRRSLPEKRVDAKEKNRERNRIYQRKRRANMTEEEKNLEKEKRRRYLQNRRALQSNAQHLQSLH